MSKFPNRAAAGIRNEQPLAVRVSIEIWSGDECLAETSHTDGSSDPVQFNLKQGAIVKNVVGGMLMAGDEISAAAMAAVKAGK